MGKFNLYQAIGVGVFIWGIMALFVFSAVSLGMMSVLWTQITLVALAGITSYFLSLGIDYDKPVMALQYGIVFVIVGAVLDLVITLQVYPALFGMWVYWASYIMILFAPILQTRSGDVPVHRAHAH